MVTVIAVVVIIFIRPQAHHHHRLLPGGRSGVLLRACERADFFTKYVCLNGALMILLSLLVICRLLIFTLYGRMVKPFGASV